MFPFTKMCLYKCVKDKEKKKFQLNLENQVENLRQLPRVTKLVIPRGHRFDLEAQDFCLY